MTNNNEQRALAVTESAEGMLAKANVLLRSRMLPGHLREPEQVVAVMLRGQELGIGPMEALTSLNFIKGRVSSSTQLMLALIYRSGLLEDIEMLRGDPATVTMKRQNMTPHTVSFGSEDAQRAGLVFKDNYKKWPETMFLWRAVAICARVVFPDVIGAIYTADELGVSLRSDETLVLEGETANWQVIDAELRQADELVEKVKALEAKGLKSFQIAKELGVSVAEVAGMLRG